MLVDARLAALSAGPPSAPADAAGSGDGPADGEAATLRQRVDELLAEKARVESDRDELSRQQGQYKAVIARVRRHEPAARDAGQAPPDAGSAWVAVHAVTLTMPACHAWGMAPAQSDRRLTSRRLSRPEPAPPSLPCPAVQLEGSVASSDRRLKQQSQELESLKVRHQCQLPSARAPPRHLVRAACCHLPSRCLLCTTHVCHCPPTPACAAQAEAAEVQGQLSAAQGQLLVTPDRCRTTQRELHEEATRCVAAAASVLHGSRGDPAA